MWTMSSGNLRAIASLATAGTVALAAGGVTAPPAPAVFGALSSTTVSVPVDLTAFGSDSLMDLVGTLTGLNFIVPLLSSPDTPLFPFVTTFEALGEVLFIMPLTLAIGTPLLLLTEGFDGVRELYSELGAVFGGLQDAFDNIMDWYATRNWLTGALLDPGSAAAVDLSGWVAGSDADEALPAVGGFEVVLGDGALGDVSLGDVALGDVALDDVAPVDLFLGDLTA
ncbi:hypothetical protein [Mycolicibacter minnesotensis]